MRLTMTPVTCVLVATAACSTIVEVGRPFQSDTATSSQLVVGQTTPEDAIRVLGSLPYKRQNLADGTMTWHWAHMAFSAYVGETDDRLLSLQFARADGEESWRLLTVMHAENIDLPAGMPLGAVVSSRINAAVPETAPIGGRLLGVFCEQPLPSGDKLPIVTRLAKGGRADTAGWQIGDTIVSVDGVPVATFTDLILATQAGGPRKLYAPRREEQIIESTITFLADNP